MSSGGGGSSLGPAIRLFHRRWSVPVVSTLYSRGGCRFVELVNHLGASRDVLSETLRGLITNGIVMKNPGHGHPLRPEYILTEGGGKVGEAATPVTRLVQRLEILEVALKKWPMLVLVAIGRGAERFNQMQADLPGITPRALTVALRDLQEAGLVSRTVTEGHPPGTSYALTGRGAEAFPDLDAFCGVVAVG